MLQGSACGGRGGTTSNPFESLFNHVHGATTHFPIALLFVSVGMDYFAGKRPGLRGSAWLLLVLGTVSATVTGLVAHPAYEDDPVLLSAIDRHRYLGSATNALFVGLTIWRWRSTRRGGDAGGTRDHLAVALAGLLGGNLLTERGIGIGGVTR